MKKSILSIALVLCMVLALLPAGVSAAKIVDSGNCGANPPSESPGPFYDTLTWTLDSDGLLTISGKGETYDHAFAWGTSPFLYNKSIRRIVIEPGMTKLGDELFVGCSNLTKITIPATVQKIGVNVFFGCSALKEIEVAKDNPYFVSVDGVLFNKDQTKLVAFPEGKTGAYTVPESVEEIGYHAFANSKLSDVQIGSKVTTLAYGAFQNADDLKHLQVPASVKTLDRMALDCGGLETLAYEDGVTVPMEVVGYGPLKAAYVPNSVEKIYVYIDQYDESKLKDIYFGGTEAEWNAKLKLDSYMKDNPDYFKGVTIHYNHKHDFKTVGDKAVCVCSLTKPVAKPAENPFSDVKDGDYFFDPVLWALNHDPQITDGMTETTFAPAETCTRGQVVTFLWRAMGCEEPTKTDNPFTDVKADDYFAKAVAWAVEKGITDGTSATTFSPADPCTRAHVVTFLCRAEGNPKGGSDNPFGDVAKGEYYTDAVLWAVSQKITDGTSDTTFSPADPCTRGQIVTFLFRDLAK